MKEYDNKDSGVLFKNNEKKQAKHPDYTGKCGVVCRECGAISIKRLASWIKEGKKGKFFSIRLSDFNEDEKPREKPKKNEDNFDDDIPF